MCDLPVVRCSSIFCALRHLWREPCRGGGGGVGTRPWWLALSACGGAYWPLAFEPSAMTSGQGGEDPPPPVVVSRSNAAPFCRVATGRRRLPYAHTWSPSWTPVPSPANCRRCPAATPCGATGRGCCCCAGRAGSGRPAGPEEGGSRPSGPAPWRRCPTARPRRRRCRPPRWSLQRTRKGGCGAPRERAGQ